MVHNGGLSGCEITSETNRGQEKTQLNQDVLRGQGMGQRSGHHQ